MQDHNSSLVNLTIPANVTQPIVAAKIQEAVLAAMGGADKIVEAVVHQIANTRISPSTGKVDSYSSNNTMLWMDFQVTSILQGAIKMELDKQIIDLSSPVKDALIKELQTKVGASKIAKALLSALDGQDELMLTFISKHKKKDNNW